MKDASRVIRVTTRLAAVLAFVITLVMPLGYFISSYQHLSGQLDAETEINGRIVSGLINANPELWRFEQLRLEELLARRPRKGERETRRILGLDGTVVAESFSPLSPPVIIRTGELMDAGMAVGLIEISRSLRPLLVRTALMALLGLSLGAAVFVTLRLLPIRAVLRADEELHRLNAELEAKVDQLREAQEELVRKEKLAILGQLAGTVGHELRNPLGGMSNAVYFLKTVLAGADETTMEYLDIIKDEINNSQRIISDLLDFARTKTPQTQAVTARALLDDSLGKCAVPENVDLVAKIPDTLPALRVDPLQIGQVLQNLIANAVQAMPGGGSLRIGARLVSPDVGAGLAPAQSGLAPAQSGYPQGVPLQGFIEISVADTGEGISPENLQKLFQPLFTTKPKGIGLGLVVCKNLTAANGGRIAVESRLGEGTTFTVILPVEEGGR